MENIVVDHLTKDYGHGRGVFDVSFKVSSGEVFGFLGPNGAGKSTTIRHLMGFSKPDSGRAMIKGLDSFSNYDKFMGQVGYLPGEIALPSGLDGYSFIDMMKKLKNVKDERFLKNLIDRFEVDLRGETKRMSLGVKRKLAIVAAFMNDPEVLVLDEPTSGLDLGMQQNFIEFIKEEKERGKTILLSSHIFGEVDATCERIAIIKDGRIVSEFNSADLKHATDKTYKIKFLTSSDKTKFLNGCKKYDFSCISDDQVNAIVKLNDKDINLLVRELGNYKFTDFMQIKESLEDYFMKYYKEDINFGGAL